MEISVAQILRAVPSTDRKRVKEFVEVFNAWSDRFGINTPLRTAHFLAQCWHESGALRYVRELSSGSQYEGRKDLGNTQKGDGQRFRGRGYIQITGRANYQAYADSGFCVGDLMRHPEWLESSPGNTKSAMWFWWRNNLSKIADMGTSKDVVTKITKRVNGGTNGLSYRLGYFDKFRKELGV